MNALTGFLQDRSAAERLGIFIGGGVIVAALLAAFAWLPLERARQRLHAQLPALRASVQALERQAEEAKRLKSMPARATATAEPLSSAITSKPLAGAQVSVVDARTLAVTASDVGFAALLDWLSTMQGAQALRVETARIEALPVPGRVRAELRLAKP
jgi:type II secretory pathway component PulM